MSGDLGHVLVIDADSTRTELLVGQMADTGYTVTIATTVEVALEAATTRTYGLVIVDAALPVAALAEIRQSPRLRTIPILLIINDESEIEQRLPFVNDCLRRPFGPTLLKLRLRSLVTHIQHEDELRVERDLEIARDIQRGFLPQELPSLPGWQLATRFVPAYEVAGDFYDVFYLTNKTRVGFIVADVCDKGIGSALFMGLSRSLLRAFAQQNYTVNWADVLDGKGTRSTRAGKTGVGVTALSNAMTLTNNYIAHNHSESNMFATLFFGILNPETGMVNYVNAGHNPPMIIGPNNEVKARLHNTSMPIGMFPDVEFGVEVAQIDPGDMLLAFTDGVTEAKNAADEQFTDERLEHLMLTTPPSAEGLLDHVQTDVQRHVGNAPQSDDITMLALRRELVN
jgi:sigma-B regulation protein RsbU (phosphoserine phosphatase)